MSLDRLERPPLLSHSVQDAIRNYILAQNLQPGDTLPPETELARQLGVGRNSVREAVKALETLGILEVRRGSGLFVRDFSLEPLLDSLPYALMSDEADLADVFEVRRILETGAIARALRSMPEESLAQLRLVLQQMQARAAADEPFVDEDREFHQLLFRHLNNQVLLALLDAFWLVFRKAAQHIDIRDPDPMKTYQDHAAIVAALEDRNIAKAQCTLDHHYNGLLRRLHAIQQSRQAAGDQTASSGRNQPEA